jgi:RNA polymerase sigma factor (sigma-70 family)
MAERDDQTSLERDIASFAETCLGRASLNHVSRPEVMAAIVARRGAGQSLEDAVLAEIHAGLPGNAALADQFAAYLLYDLMRMGSNSMAASSGLRRFLDTGDLVLSVFGDLWHDIPDVKFDSCAQFKMLFAQRLNWKAASSARRFKAGSRGEQHRLAHSPEELDLAAHDEGATPLNAAIREEERARLILILLRVSDRDRQVLTLHLKGLGPGEIAQRLGLPYDAARMSLSRAIDRARKLAQENDEVAPPARA